MAEIVVGVLIWWFGDFQQNPPHLHPPNTFQGQSAKCYACQYFPPYGIHTKPAGPLTLVCVGVYYIPFGVSPSVVFGVCTRPTTGSEQCN